MTTQVQPAVLSRLGAEVDDVAQAVDRLRVGLDTEARLPGDAFGTRPASRHAAAAWHAAVDHLEQRLTDITRMLRQHAAATRAAGQAYQTTDAGMAARYAELRARGAQLHRGMRGSDVTRLQRDLQSVGIEPGPIDGVYGDRTAAAMAALALRGEVVRLRRGDRGTAVAALQQHLHDAGYDPGRVDGIFGPSTAIAVEQFNGRHQDPLPAPPVPSGGRNGALTAAHLAAVGDNERMAREAAQAFRDMDAAAHRANLDLHVNSGYRTVAEQEVLYRRFLAGVGAPANPPGTSNHGWGLSADINVTDSRVLQWLRRHAVAYGFINDVAREPWHWTYYGR